MNADAIFAQIAAKQAEHAQIRVEMRALHARQDQVSDDMLALDAQLREWTQSQIEAHRPDRVTA